MNGEGLARFKSAFQRHPHYIHLNNAGQAPLPLCTRDAICEWTSRLSEEGAFSWRDCSAAVEKSRGTLARFIHCQADELAFFQSVSGAVSQVAFGMDLHAGDEILTWDQEFPSNSQPWFVAAKRVGARVIRVPSGPDLSTPYERLVESISPKTRVIAISWVQYKSGAVTQLEPIVEIAKERGIWTVIDCIQGLGILPLDFAHLGVDALCGGGHKWLAGPYGTGFLAIRQERIEQLAPIQIGARSFVGGDDQLSLEPSLREGATRFEPGARPMLEIAGLGVSVKLLLSVGREILQEECERLAQKLAKEIRRRGYTVLHPNGSRQCGGIVSFKPIQESGLASADIAGQLVKKGIGCASRGSVVRLSPHAFNTDSDIERTLDALSEVR